MDVTIQAQILKLMRELQEETGTSILMITHNLGVVAEMCDRVGVMYAGVMAEVGPMGPVFKEPLHPYTQGLMNSIPKVNIDMPRLETIEGNVPNLIKPPSGCRFHPRCPYAMDICRKEKPPMMEIRPNHMAACHLYTGVTFVSEEYLDRGHQPEEVLPHPRGFLQEGAGSVKAIDGVRFPIKRGETLGLVGESGCGKTTTGRCTLQLIRPTGGNIYYKMPAKDRARMVELEALEAEIVRIQDERPKNKRRRRCPDHRPEHEGAMGAPGALCPEPEEGRGPAAHEAGDADRLPGPFLLPQS